MGDSNIPMSVTFGVHCNVIITACSELCIGSVFGAVCDFLFVYEISLESLNGFAPNSQENVFGSSLGRV